MKRLFPLLIAIIVLSLTITAQTNNHWRGEQRTGIYNETNLLKEWPDDGPEMVWAFEELGKGFTSVVPANEKIFITGLIDKVGYLFILSLDGKLEKKIPYGEEVYGRAEYPGPRSSPAVVENLVYITSGHGKLICLDWQTEQEVWSIDLFNDFDGKNIRWSITENLIIDGDVLYVAPGGEKYNVVALNRFTGEQKWISSGKGEVSAHCSPLLFKHNNRKILATMMGEHILGFDAENGKLLWSHPYKNKYNIYPNTPIYHNGEIYFFSGYGKGGQKFKLNDDGSEINLLWTDETLDNQMGGAILMDGYIYGSGHNNRSWYCLDWVSGEILYESSEIAKGTVIAADGMLYAYSDRGELALLEPQNGSFKLISKVDITLGSEQHWAHLVIHNGILYVRHGEALMAFDVRKK